MGRVWVYNIQVGIVDKSAIFEPDNIWYGDSVSWTDEGVTISNSSSTVLIQVRSDAWESCMDENLYLVSLPTAWMITSTYFCCMYSWARWCLGSNPQSVNKPHHRSNDQSNRNYLFLGSTDHNQQQYKMNSLNLQKGSQRIWLSSLISQLYFSYCWKYGWFTRLMAIVGFIHCFSHTTERPLFFSSSFCKLRVDSRQMRKLWWGSTVKEEGLTREGRYHHMQPYKETLFMCKGV